ncbi:MAG: flavodoxin domain-containing protein [Candidatus Dormibacteraeota bacterium]|nr:flavodoxin domain-containing protein [Candidatus Dormibacteraeota bacterium]
MSAVLVAYATKHGSTREVAESIAATLRDHGNQVDLLPAGELRNPIVGLDLVVLGAPIYSGRWHRDAHRFLKRHREELLQMPVAVFGMGPRDGDQEAWRRSREQLDRALARRDWLTPAAVALFGGVDPPKRRSAPRRDQRDWDAIRAWANAIAPLASAATSRR